MGWRKLTVITLLLVCAIAQAQVSGSLETYFDATPGTSGFAQTRTWGELNAHLSSNLKATLSGTRLPVNDFLDEACIQWRSDALIARVGRFRTAFGFSDWSELFYNGFNHVPLARAVPLVDRLRLMRDDAGIEVTGGGPSLQVQAALVDTDLDRYQLVPDRVDHATIRFQRDFGPLLLGLDALHRLTDRQAIYGIDARWSAPRWIVRAEYMTGAGGESDASGFYLDASYRLPKLPRTQAVARTEVFGAEGKSVTLHTVGMRQILRESIALNLNYTWGSSPDLRYITTSSLCGWTARAMFQLVF